MAFRLTGSPDIFEREQREPEQSINFVTCHDGFTLNDLVSFNTKHNEANGEGNRDGANYNLSWNCGVEGPTPDPEIEQLRNRQVKNFLALTLLATGTPMLLMGDEVRRTQSGNNNAFCQDNETSWFDWTLVENHADIQRFVQGAHCGAHEPRSSDRSPRPDSERALAATAVPMAWGEVEFARLGPLNRTRWRLRSGCSDTRSSST